LYAQAQDFNIANDSLRFEKEGIFFFFLALKPYLLGEKNFVLVYRCRLLFSCIIYRESFILGA